MDHKENKQHLNVKRICKTVNKHSKINVHSFTTFNIQNIAVILCLICAFLQTIRCSHINRENLKLEGHLYNRHTIGVYQLIDSHIIGTSMPNFLKDSEENRITMTVIGKRKREVGLMVPEKYTEIQEDFTYIKKPIPNRVK